MPDLSLATNLTQVTEVFNLASTVSENVLGMGILFVVFFGLLMLLSAFSRADSFLASSFVTLVLAIIIRYIGLVDDAVVLFVLVIFFSSLAAAYMAKNAVSV